MNKRELLSGILAAAVIGIPSMASANEQPEWDLVPVKESVLICNIPLKFGKTMTLQFEKNDYGVVKSTINYQMLSDIMFTYDMDIFDIAKNLVKTYPRYRTVSYDNNIWLWEKRSR